MRRAHALLLLLIGLIAFGLWWLLGGGGGDAPDVSGSSASTADEAPAELVPGASAPEAAAGLARTDAPSAAEEPAEAPSRALTVRVVLAADGKPAAGAEVLLLPVEAHKRLSTEEFVLYQQASYDEKLDRWGRAFPCDAAGIAHIPVPNDAWFVVGARAAGIWGRRDVRPEEKDLLTEIEISLRPAIHVTVQVVDESRLPVSGVPVAYRALNRGRGHSLQEVVTDADGLARLRHLQEGYYNNAGNADQNVVAIGLPLEPTVQAVFDPLHPPGEPILLVMPSTGSVEVAVFDVQGRPAQGLQVALQKQMSVEDRRAYGETKGMIHQSWLGMRWMPLQDGIARFDQVGLGLTVEFGADFERTSVMESGSGPGPARPGEVVRYALRQKSAAPILTGRIVDDAGNPLADVGLDTWVHPAGGGRYLARLRIIADADGRFRCSMGLDPADASPKILFADQKQRGLVRILTAPLPAPLLPGENEIGDLVLGGPLLVSGVVLTPEGEPAPTAYGSVEPAASGLFSRDSDEPFDDMSWQAGEDGRFEIRGSFPVRTYQVRAWVSAQKDWRLEAVKFEPGARDLQIRFQRPPGVRGRVIADADVNVQDLSVGLMREGGGTGTSPDAEGKFVLLIKDPGTYDLELRTRFGGNLLLARRNLALTADGSLDLGELDLRGLPRTRIALLDPAGQPIAQANIVILDGAAKAQRFSFPLDFPLTLLHTSEQRSVFIEAAGFAREAVALNGGEQTVRFRPGIRVSLTLEGLPSVPEGFEWAMNLYQRDDGLGLDSSLRQTLITGSNQIDLRLPVPGKWTVFLWLRSGNSSGQVPRAFGETDPIIEIMESGSAQGFHLVVDPAAVALAISKR